MMKFSKLEKEVLVPVYVDEKPALELPTEASEESIQRIKEAWERELADWQERQAAKVRVRRMPRPTVRRWLYAHEAIKAQNRKERRELKAQIPAEDDPALHDPSAHYVTEACAIQLQALMAEVVRASVIELIGVDCAVDAETYKSPDGILEVLDHTEMLGAVFAAVLRAQAPGRRENFC